MIHTPGNDTVPLSSGGERLALYRGGALVG